MDDNFFLQQKYYPIPDNFFSPKKDIHDIDINNNFNFDFNINSSNDNINRMNMLPLNKRFYHYIDDNLIQY